MSYCVNVRTYPAPPYDDGEILRYTGCRVANEAIKSELDKIKDEAELSYRVCYASYPVTVSENECKIGDTVIKSSDLASRLSDCTGAIIFIATVGVGIDRLINKYARISQSRALLAEAVGNERVEALCDLFCTDIEKEYGFATKRFSPGYFDLSLEYQRDIFALLRPEGKIGVCLSSSLLMTPCKTVSAIVGIK